MVIQGPNSEAETQMQREMSTRDPGYRNCRPRAWGASGGEGEEAIRDGERGREGGRDAELSDPKFIKKS